MIKNDTVASRRRMLFAVTTDDGVTPAPRNTDFTGCVWLDPSSGSLVAANNNLVNSRRTLTGISLTITANAATDVITSTAHGLQLGDGPFTIGSTGTQPGGVSPAPTGYYAVPIDANTFKIATTLANAYLAVPVTVDITSNGTGTITMVSATGCQRGLDGDFWLQVDQTETNFDGDYLYARVEKATFAVAHAFAKMDIAGSVWDQVGEGSHTYGDLVRLNASILAGPVLDFTTNTLVFKSLDGTKTRWTVTVSAAGRLTVTPGDLT